MKKASLLVVLFLSAGCTMPLTKDTIIDSFTVNGTNDIIWLRGDGTHLWEADSEKSKGEGGWRFGNDPYHRLLLTGTMKCPGKPDRNYSLVFVKHKSTCGKYTLTSRPRKAD